MDDYMDPSYPRRRAGQIVDEVLAEHAAREGVVGSIVARRDLERRQAARREAALEPFRAYGRACAQIAESLSQITDAFAQGAAEVRVRQ